MDSNAFNSTGRTVDPGLGVASGAVGLLLVTVAFMADPWGPVAVVMSWVFVLLGVVLAILPSRLRPIGKGLAFAGAALPGAAFLFLWVVVSFAALTGSM